LYNLRFKPTKFSEMVGQDSTLKGLKNRAKDLNFPKYAMFRGESGSGKTVSAHIVAKTLNCVAPVLNDEGYYDPCNQCDSCKDILEGNFHRDIIKVSGADVNKEEAIKLGKSLMVSSFTYKNKILIIEEAHLIASAQAVNVFLDICDSIISNVYVFFVTSKPETFKSDMLRRFQAFKFEKVVSADVQTYLADVLDKLDLFETLSDEFIFKGLPLIADISDGSPGRAINLLETCIYNELYTTEAIEHEFNTISTEKEFDIMEKLLAKDSSVLTQLQMINLEDFYNRSRTILTDASIYSITKEVVDDWKVHNAKRLDKYDKLDLLRYYGSAYSKGYFDKAEFLYSIVRYFKEGEIINQLYTNNEVKTPSGVQETPVTRVQPRVRTRVRQKKV